MSSARQTDACGQCTVQGDGAFHTRCTHPICAPSAQPAGRAHVRATASTLFESRRPALRVGCDDYCGGGISFSTWIAATSREPSGSFGAPATKTFLPAMRSSLVPGLVVAMMVFGVTSIFFSSSGLPATLYLTVRT